MHPTFNRNPRCNPGNASLLKRVYTHVFHLAGMTDAVLGFLVTRIAYG